LGGGLSLGRTWNSIWPASQITNQVGWFGTRWKSNFDERVFLSSDHFVKYMRSDGSFWSFGLNSNGPGFDVVAPANEKAILVGSASGSAWTLTFQNGEKRTFDGTTGKLTAIIDRNGNTTQVAYDSSGRLVTVTDAAGRHLYFTYGSPTSLLVTGVSSDFGVSLSYSYDASGRLTQVVKPDLTTINYTYNSQSLITSVTDSQGKVLESHTYDSQGRGLTGSQANGIGAVTISYP
jgi:YD repeat-containing protein